MKLRTTGGLGVVLLSLSACSAGSSADESIDSSATALDLISFYPGRGYVANADKAAGDCLITADNKLIVDPVRAANVGGQEVTYSLTKITSAQEMQDKLKISASASASFLVGSVDAKMSFSESTKTSATAVTLLASVVVKNTAWTVPPGIKIADDAAQLMRAGTIGRFRERCGDGFIQSYLTGGEFHAIVQIQTSSKEEMEKINASIKGSYFTASGSVDFNKEMESIVKSSSTVVNSFQVGGEGIESSPCRDVKCVADRVIAFPTAVARKPVVIDQEIAKYDVLNWPKDSVSPLDISTALDVETELNRQRNFTKDKLNQFLEVQSRPEVFALNAPNATLSQVSAAISILNANMTAYTDSLKACSLDVAKCVLPATIQAVTTKVPPAKSPESIVMLRPYNKPSAFLQDGFPMLSPCDSHLWAGTGPIDDRAQAGAATLRLISGVSGAASSVSFQSLLEPSKVVTTYLGTSCSKRVEYRSATSSDLKEKATFFKVPGLNGKPNTWSFRLYNVTSAPVAGEPMRNRDPNTYLSLSRVTPISVQARPDTTDQPTLDAFNDAVSWYVDQQ